MTQLTSSQPSATQVGGAASASHVSPALQAGVQVFGFAPALSAEHETRARAASRTSAPWLFLICSAFLLKATQSLLIEARRSPTAASTSCFSSLLNRSS